MSTSLASRRAAQWICVIAGGIMLGIGSLQIWRMAHPPAASDRPTPVADVHEDDNTPPPPPVPVQEPPKVVDNQPSETPDADSPFRLTGFTGGAKKEIKESFDSAKAGALPKDWSQWSNGKGLSFEVAAAKGLSEPNILVSAGPSNLTAYAWPGAEQHADSQGSVGINLNTLIAAGVFVRGSNFDSGAPTCYAATITRGVEATLWRIVGGKATKLGSVKSKGYLSEKWARLTIQADGKTIRMRVCRLDDLEIGRAHV